MSLANEAGYLYVYSKKLHSLKKEIKNCKEESEQLFRKHTLAKDQKEKDKIQNKKDKKAKELHHLIEKHSELLTKLRHHQIAFSHRLQEEQHIQ